MTIKIKKLFEENPNVGLEEAYQFVAKEAVDIYEHCPTLVSYAQQCNHVTEMGTRWGASTIAFLYAQPKYLVAYDWKKQSTVNYIAALAGKTEFSFLPCSTLEVEIDETDLLFIDTLHTYEQLKAELSLHCGKAKKYIIMHDTVKFGKKGQRDDEIGLGPALKEFLDVNDDWRLHEHFTNNNGLTVLRRK